MGRTCDFRVLRIDELPSVLQSRAAGAFILDSLDLFEFAPEKYRAAGRSFALMTHYLPSMSSMAEQANVLFQRELAALSQYDRYVTTGAYATQYMSRFGFEAQRIVEVLPPAPRYGVLSHPVPPPLRALIVANVLEQKGIRELLLCLRSSVVAGDPLSLQIVGRLDAEPAYAAECVRLSAEPPLFGRVHFSGVVPPERVVDYYQWANLFVSVSKMETFGMALQEARAAGLPLLVLDAGNAGRHVSDGAGEVVPSIADVASRLLELCRTPEKLRVMSSRAEARRNARHTYDWDDAAQTLLTALRGLTHSR